MNQIVNNIYCGTLAQRPPYGRAGTLYLSYSPHNLYIDTGKEWVSLGVPPGGIILWSGPTSVIPTGFALCDGTNGTPDLRGQFVRGAPAGKNPGVGDTSAVTHLLNPTNPPCYDLAYIMKV